MRGNQEAKRKLEMGGEAASGRVSGGMVGRERAGFWGVGGPNPVVRAACADGGRDWFTLIHFCGWREHFMWDTLNSVSLSVTIAAEVGLKDG